jgi:phosphopantothenoylcysteine decarboxylase/phosphopantothenate--cysteine ligase
VLTGKNILLGITGSIAAYKSVDVARRLVECGAGVNVVMTEAACRFIPPYTLETVTGNPVHTDLFINPFSHINLSKEADLLIIAPVTANTINKISCGLADDLLSNIWLTYEGPVLMAPAMNYRMYRNAIVQKNIKGLQGSDVKFIGPEKGSLACGEEGAGRMADVPEIIEAAVSALTPKDLRKHNILVTAGPTIEPPSSLKPPAGANFVPVEKASEMETAVLKYFPKATSVIMAAAVSDFTPSLKSKVKLKKDDINTLKLKRNNDILKKLGKKKAGKTLIGFAAETGNGVKKAEKKLKEKNLDMIVMNNVLQDGAGFDSDTNIITIIDKKGKIEKHPKMKKIEAANIILDKMLKLKKR